MAMPRSMIVDLAVTPFYHCTVRCVRRSFLCGEDKETGRNYNHRKKWIVARLKYLASIFAIKICAYAVMSNHYHVVVFINETQMLAWTDEEVKQRWAALFPRDAKLLENSLLEKDLKDKIALWRSRLGDISWFMRCLNETIARLSNREDDVKGRFWEGRFKSQALLDEGAILAAMVYVDLNPIRAKVAMTPEESEFTSIYERIQMVAKQMQKNKQIQNNNAAGLSEEKIARECDNMDQPSSLMSFTNGQIKGPIIADKLDYKLSDYIQLVDLTGRILREDKRGAIPDFLSPIFSRLNLSSNGWFDMMKNLEKNFYYAIGHAVVLADFGNPLKKRAPKGINVARKIYLSAA